MDISAFGVVHKSFVNGRFTPITQMKPKRLDKLRQGGHWKKARGVSDSDKTFVGQMDQLKAARPELEANNGKIQPGLLMPSYSAGGATVRTGSAKRGKSYVAMAAGNPKSKVAQKVKGHEHQHAKVKRSSYRLHGQIATNPKKLWREEARADYRGPMGHYKDKTADGMYANAARAQDAMKRGKKLVRPTEAILAEARDAGIEQKKFPPKRIFDGSIKTQVNAMGESGPKYAVKAEKSVGAYRKLQDDMRRRGVPRGQL